MKIKLKMVDALKKEIDTKSDLRLEAIKKWVVSDLKINDFTINIASADASFRRYFRLTSASDSWVIMDAPPDKEDCQDFIVIAKLIEKVGVQSPHIFNFNQQQGFMQLSDLGCTAYLDKLNNETSNDLYSDAIQSIVKIQTIQAALPLYDEGLLQLELNLFKDWYLEKHLNIKLTDAQNKVLLNVFELLINSALQEDMVFVHRDFHSRNLMITHERNPGVIDFQDAVNGPASYDLVSLLKDCYISWPREKLLHWIDEYLECASIKVDKELFIKQFDLMGLQRHLKVLGIFSRLKYRDGKDNYINDMPLTLAYVVDVCQRYNELNEFKQLLTDLALFADNELLERIK